jgi:uncharacterized protein (TIGR02145 family)
MYAIQMRYDSEAITIASYGFRYMISVRLIKNTSPDYITDIDGNIYTTVNINGQVWMVENFKATKLNDGTPIPNLTADAAWQADSAGAYCWYDNNIGNKVFGALYNWYAINLANFAPAGWHVPTQAEWDALAAFAGGAAVAGGHLKEVGYTHWYTPNTAATDTYGFKAQPNGERMDVGTFDQVGNSALMWTADELDAATAWLRGMSNAAADMTDVAQVKEYGFGVRLIKD